MKITKDTVVTLRCRVTNATTGALIEDDKQPIAYLHGGYGDTLPRIEAELEGQEPGFATTLEVGPADGYGERDEAKVISISKADFPPGVKVGGMLRTQLESGEQAVYRVAKIKGPQVILDGNHAWAGLKLRMKLQVLEVRMASGEEIAHQHVHGDHGHHH